MADVTAICPSDVKPLTNATYCVADVITTVADGIATAGWEYLWQMLMPSGRWKKPPGSITSILVLGC